MCRPCRRLSQPRRRLPLSASVPTRCFAFWPPVVAWCAATAAIVSLCLVQGWAPFAASKTWSRADSFWYLRIARHGYTLVPCGSVSGASAWCGTAGWFPAYPWIVAFFGHLGLPLAPTALRLVSGFWNAGHLAAMPSRGRAARCSRSLMRRSPPESSFATRCIRSLCSRSSAPRSCCSWVEGGTCSPVWPLARRAQLSARDRRGGSGGRVVAGRPLFFPNRTSSRSGDGGAPNHHRRSDLRGGSAV